MLAPPVGQRGFPSYPENPRVLIGAKRGRPLRDHEIHGVPVHVVAVLAAGAAALPHGGQLDGLVDGRALLAQELANR